MPFDGRDATLGASAGARVMTSAKWVVFVCVSLFLTAVGCNKNMT